MVCSDGASDGLPLTVENLLDVRLDLAMIGRSESNEGCLGILMVYSWGFECELFD